MLTPILDCIAQVKTDYWNACNENLCFEGTVPKDFKLSIFSSVGLVQFAKFFEFKDSVKLGNACLKN